MLFKISAFIFLLVGNLGEEEIGSFYCADLGSETIYQILQKNKSMPWIRSMLLDD